jgi:hypothetical protein
MLKNLKHDISYGAMLVMQNRPWMKELAGLRAAVAFDLYEAFKLVINVWEERKGDARRLYPSNN